MFLHSNIIGGFLVCSAAILQVWRLIFTAAGIGSQCKVSVGPSVLWQPAHRPAPAAAPAPSLRGLPVLRRSAHHSLLASVLKFRQTGGQSLQPFRWAVVKTFSALTPSQTMLGGISITASSGKYLTKRCTRTPTYPTTWARPYGRP